MKRSLVSFAALALLLSACASHRAQPEWTIDGRSKAYPPSEYLSGTGVANSMTTARTRARDNLSKVFEIEVEAADDGSHAAASSYANLASVRGLIRGQESQIMRGMQIAETWKNPETQVSHAFAVLSRKQAASNLRAEVRRLDETTSFYLQRSKTDNDVLHKIRDAQFAIDVQVARAAYVQSLHVIEPQETAAPDQWKMADLNAGVDKLLKLVRVEAQLPANSDPRLQQDVELALGHAGFLVAAGAKADFLLETQLTMQDLGYQGNWDWVRGTLSVNLVQRRGKVERGSYQWTIKAAGSSAADAQNRVMGQIPKLLNKELRDVIVRIATH